MLSTTAQALEAALMDQARLEADHVILLEVIHCVSWQATDVRQKFATYGEPFKENMRILSGFLYYSFFTQFSANPCETNKF